MDEQIEDEISHDDNTPSILDQAHKEGWNAAYYNFGKAEGGRDWFNPAIIQRGEELWMLVRGSEPHPQGFRFGQNFIWAFEMDESGKTPKRGIKLHWKVDNPEQHFEDPRGFYNPNIGQTIIGACTFIWYPDGRWTGAHQCIGSFDDDWQCSKMDYPKIGGSPGALDMLFDKKKYEKNWLPFLHDNSLHILYKAKPWHIVGYGQTWSDSKNYESEGVSWAHGDVRGGTSPVRVGDMYFTFPHSSLPWRSRYRRYYAGAMAFDANPPFTPRLITPEPILRGSQNDPWAQKKPLVVFPCGAIYKDETWLVTCGVNDMKAAWIEIPHEDLLKRMVPIGKSGGSVFPVNGLTDSEIEARKKLLSGGVVMREQSCDPDSAPSRRGLSDTPTAPNLSRLEKLRANAAKARAVRASNLEAKRLGMVKNPEYETASHEVEFKDGMEIITPRKKRTKRRKRRTKAQMAAARLQALREYEASEKNACER